MADPTGDEMRFKARWPEFTGGVDGAINAEKGELIDGVHVLRGAAATIVVMHHAQLAFQGSSWPTWGACGVDIFFVISGYLMALTTQAVGEESLSERSAHSLSFAKNRILRIVPLYWLALIWTARRSWSDYGLLKDFLFIPRPSPCLPGVVGPLLTQGWTLNFEMMFYAIFALGMLFRRWRFAVVTLGLLLLLLLPTVGVTGDAATFYSNSIVLEFGMGIALFFVVKNVPFPRWGRLAYLLVAAFGIAMLALGDGHEPRGLIQGPAAFVTVWGSFKACEGWLRSKFLQLLGDASYAIYLFHWASFGALKLIIPIIGPQHSSLLIVVHIVVGVSAGITVHLLVEKRLTPRAFSRGWTLGRRFLADLRGGASETSPSHPA